MAAMWLLAAIHVRWKRSSLWPHILSGTFVLLALLSKEAAVVALPLLLLLDHRFSPAEKQTTRAWIKRAAAPLIATLCYFSLRKITLGAFLPSTQALAFDSTPWHFWDGPVRSAHYLFLMLWPAGLTPHHIMPAAEWPTGITIMTAWILGGWYLWKKPSPNALLGTLWFLFALAPIAHWLPVQVRFSGLFLYLPLIGVSFALVAAIQSHRLAVIGILVISGVLALFSASQLTIWSSEQALWQHAVLEEPESAPSHLALGHALQLAGKANGDREFSAAYHLALKQNDGGTASKAAFSRANLALSQANPGAATVFFEQAISAGNHRFYPALLGLARIQMSQNQLSAALKLAQQARELAPSDADVFNTLGILAARMGKPTLAFSHFEQAVRLHPNDLKLQNNLKMLRQSLPGTEAPPTPQ